MKRFETKWALLIGLLLIGAFVATLAYPSKYTIGMSLDEAVTLAKPAQLKLYGTGLDADGHSKEQMEKEVFYTAYDSHAGVFLELNNEKRIIGVRKWKYFGINFAELIRKFKNN
jgi:hypothetical protein